MVGEVSTCTSGRFVCGWDHYLMSTYKGCLHVTYMSISGGLAVFPNYRTWTSNKYIEVSL